MKSIELSPEIKIEIGKNGKIKIIRRSRFLAKVITFYLQEGQIKVIVVNFWKNILRKPKDVKDILKKGHSIYFTYHIEVLENILECKNIDELCEKIEKGEIQKGSLLGIIETLFINLF